MTGIFKFLSLLPLLLSPGLLHAQKTIDHRLEVRIDPEKGTIEAKDRLSLPNGMKSWDFLLHEGLAPRIAAGEGKLRRVGGRDHLEQFRLTVRGNDPVTLDYAGRISHELKLLREGMGRARQDSRGIISGDGVVLSGYSGWYPRNPDFLQSVDLTVRLPRGWTAVSQGAGPDVKESGSEVRVRWRESRPQDDIYLIAAPFERYSSDHEGVEAQVYLRRADPDLAQRYLAATGRYLELYGDLIGPYPYEKFALVENFWETGFGMPSFTLLGSRVIRLPFIIHTSYPHEVLHNWWGNGVYVDYETGNWSEGLTAYLADHLVREQRGDGAGYRRDSLRAYADYVREANDFPLEDFRGRHGTASQAVGYGKTLMMIHMLRRDLGDRTFVAGLRRFYRDNLFRTAGFGDLRRALEQESGRDLGGFFREWTGRTGAPTLSVSGLRTEARGERHLVRGRLEQTQEDAPFPLLVPVIVHVDGGAAVEHRVALEERSADFEVELPSAPVRVDVDPRFDMFRALEPGESPTTLSALFGAEDGLILLPADAPPSLARAYARLAESWRAGSAGWEIASDADFEQIPEGRPVWLVGWSNRFLADLAGDGRMFRLDGTKRRLRLDVGEFPGGEYSLALVREDEARPIGWVAASDPAAVPGLARKLPHYGKYSFLAFEGPAPTNRSKVQWPVQESPLMVWMSDQRPPVTVPARPPLTAILENSSRAGAE